MIVNERRGNILNSDCQTVVITTNCVGVMGKGLAKSARLRHPALYRAYRDLYLNRMLRVDRPYLVSLPDDQKFLLFPTKDHWREPSRLEWIETNLRWIADNYPKGELVEVTSLAVPPLGCGLGGLDYALVKPLIEQYLHPLSLPVTLYLP